MCSGKESMYSSIDAKPAFLSKQPPVLIDGRGLSAETVDAYFIPGGVSASPIGTIR
jgi:hypothetical protein